MDCEKLENERINAGVEWSKQQRKGKSEREKTKKSFKIYRYKKIEIGIFLGQKKAHKASTKAIVMLSNLYETIIRCLLYY